LTATIDQPLAGAVVAVGDDLSFAGSVSWSDGLPFEGTVAWNSSLDGELGSELAGTWSTATAGEQMLTFQATQGSDTAVAGVSVIVQAPAPAGLDRYGDDDGLPATTTYNDLKLRADGTLLAATDAGLIAFDPELGATIYTSADGLPDDRVLSVAEDTFGVLWLGFDQIEGIEGQRFTLVDGVLTAGEVAHWDRTGEIFALYRIEIQPYGPAAGDVWMGTNEGMCLFERAESRLIEHGHPTHPHLPTYGLGFTTDAHAWNGDQHQLSRWDYDGDNNIFNDLVEIVPTWPVEEGELISVTDLTVDADDTVWVTSSLFGVAKVEVATEVGASVVTLLTEPATAQSIGATVEGNVFVGTADGLTVLDSDDVATAIDTGLVPTDVQQLLVDPSTSPSTVWAATPTTLVRMVGVPVSE